MYKSNQQGNYFYHFNNLIQLMAETKGTTENTQQLEKKDLDAFLNIAVLNGTNNVPYIASIIFQILNSLQDKCCNKSHSLIMIYSSCSNM